MSRQNVQSNISQPSVFSGQSNISQSSVFRLFKRPVETRTGCREVLYSFVRSASPAILARALVADLFKLLEHKINHFNFYLTSDYGPACFSGHESSLRGSFAVTSPVSMIRGEVQEWQKMPNSSDPTASRDTGMAHFSCPYV